MKRFLSAILAALLLIGAACADEARTRESIATIEGLEETIVETLYESPQGFRVWYPADLFDVSHEDGNDYFLSAVAGADVGVAIVDPQMPSEYIDEFVAELLEISIANDGRIMGEVEQRELASGITVKHADIVFDDDFNSVYYVYDAHRLFCISCYYPTEAAEGWGARIEQMISTIEWVD